MTIAPDAPTIDANAIDTAVMADRVVAQVERWLDESAGLPVDRAAQQLAGVLGDPGGLAFTVGFIDGVIRPEDTRIAARNFARLARDVPRFLPLYLQLAVRLGAIAAVIVPPIVIPIVRWALRKMVGHLVIDATDAKLGRAIEKLRSKGARLNINLLGEAVLGEHEAARRLDGTKKLLARPDVDYVSIKVSSTVAPHSAWSFDETVASVVERLTPLYQQARAASPAKFINLDMEEYRDLDLTIAVFTAILDRPDLMDLEAGIVLQAYLPDALGAMTQLQDWAARRRQRGGASIKVRVVKGANLPMERVEADLHGWPLATWSSKQETDTNYKRVIEYAFTPERMRNVRVGVAGHNLFDLAFAWLLANDRGVARDMEVEMLLGMAQAQAEVIRRTVGGLLLYTPVVHPREFDVAIAYLIRRLEEGASQDNFMSAIFELRDDEWMFNRERDRFLASLDELDDAVPAANRIQNRLLAPQPLAGAAFGNADDTDSAVAENREWAARILARVPASKLGLATIAANTVRDAAGLDAVIARTVEAGRAWGGRTGAERAEILERAADQLELGRGELIEVAAAEAGKTIDQSDPEISEAIDFARYYAKLARGLDEVDGATPVPVGLTLVTPPWNFPVAIPAGGVLAALAAGSGVILKPARQAARCGAVLAEALWEAGVPRDALHYVYLEDRALGQQLVADPRVDRVILTGAYETAELFRSFRPDLPLLAETSGKNAIIVTPSADLDLAAKDVAYSAFGHAGQKCSAASLVILVGSVARSRRFRAQLVDAVSSLKVGPPEDPTTQMGPIIEPANGKLLEALTTVQPGEQWLVEPRKLDADGKLWSPGVVDGVRRGSRTHLVEYFGPVLGVMTARTIEEAIEIQNEVEYGLTAGLHSLDADEVQLWLDRVQAGNLYVNRGTTGAIVQRQPFGGWKKSAVGPGTKAGGPNYLFGLTGWKKARSSAKADRLDPRTERLVIAARRSKLPATTVASLERATASDAAAWTNEYGTARDVSGLDAERNVLRYSTVPVAVRLAEGGSVGDLLRVLAAGSRAGAGMTVSTGVELPRPVVEAIIILGIPLKRETDRQWYSGLAHAAGRIRGIGVDAVAVAEATDGRPDVALYDGPVTESGRLEMLPFLREQAVSITAHRFGNPSPLADALHVG